MTSDLQALNQAVARDLDLLAYPEKCWLPDPSDGADVLDCAIIGGGQLGLSVAFGLMRERVTNIRIFDANPEGREGPWITFARMETLRTPKVYSGPENGFPNLSFRAWFEAAHGTAAWDDITKIPRQHWMEYLVWFRNVLNIPVQNQSSVTRVEPISDALFRLSIETPTGVQEVLAKTVLFATGAFGAGKNFVPSVVADLPRTYWRHANEEFDHDLFRGKRVGVLGAGASAFDAAATAIEMGAVSADICFRRESFPTQNPRRFLETAGFLSRYCQMTDDLKWQCNHHLLDIGQPPPSPTYRRAMTRGATLRPLTPWKSATITTDGAIKIETGAGTVTYDFLVVATGSEMDLSQRPELAAMAPHIATWGDVYSPPEGLENGYLSSQPYQSTLGQLTEKQVGQAPYLKRAFLINGASLLSLGPTIHSCAALRYATPLLVTGIVNALFQDVAPGVIDRLVNEVHYEAGLEDLDASPSDHDQTLEQRNQ